jgi:plasmid stabilization system protein ParE
MSGYTLHSEAFNDIDEIRAYIAEDDPDAADLVITAIFDRIRALVALPHQGYRRPNLTSRPMRFALVYEYVKAYAPEKMPLLDWALNFGSAPQVLRVTLDLTIAV